MKKVFLIFRKDLIHLWPELLLSLAVTAAFAFLYPIKWGVDIPRFQNLDPRMERLLSSIADILLVVWPASWAFLLVRAVQSDSTIGNRQFWLTRPYGWKNLLAAKVLFAFTFVGLPYILAEAALLFQFGFSPLSYIPGLLFNLVLIAAVGLLPIFAFATVTRNFARLSLTMLVLVILTGLTAYFMDLLNLGPIRTVSNPYSSHLFLLLLVVFFGAAVLIQYATRRVWSARLVISSGTVAALFALLPSPTGKALFEHAYLRLPLSIPVHLVPAAGEVANINNFDYRARGNGIRFDIPIEVSGIPGGYAISSDNVLVKFTAADGSTSVSQWEQQRDEFYLPGTQRASLDVHMDRKFYEHVQGKPVAIHVTLAVSKLAAGRTDEYQVQQKLNLGRLGLCYFDYDVAGDLDPSSINCRTAMREYPKLTLLTVEWTLEPCDTATPGDFTEHTAWDGNSEPDPSDIDLRPVSAHSSWFQSDSYRAWREGQAGARRPNLCPGIPLKATAYNVIERGWVGFDLGKLLIPPKSNTYLQ